MTVALLKREAAHTSPCMKSTSALQQALQYHQRGDVHRAEALYRDIQQSSPEHTGISNLLGVCRLQLGDPAGALAHLQKAVQGEPENPEFRANLAQALLQQSENALALAHLHFAVAKLPTAAPLQLLLADDLLALGQSQEALATYDRAIALQPNLFAAHNNRGNALLALGDAHAALQSFDQAQRLEPAHPAVFSSRAAALLALRRSADALQACERALQLDPNLLDALFNRGNALLDLQRLEEAALAFQQVLQIDARHLRALHNLGLTLQLLHRHAEAAVQFQRLLRIKPEYPYVSGHLLAARLHTCDWSNLKDLRAQALLDVEAGKPALDPFTLLSFCDEPAMQRLCAERYVANEIAVAPIAPNIVQPAVRCESRDRIRLAYVSADLHDHATARLLAELIELHDRGQFEVTGVSLGPDDHSPMRARLVRGFDTFIDAREFDDAQLVSRLRQSRIDIAVDLKGHTAGSRFGVFAARAAPLQVAFLGYPGTSGAPFIDYLVADEVVIPPEQRSHYSEKIAFLSGCYQVNDRHRQRPLPPTGGRERLGLPTDGFVYCCFNNSYKILPEMFDVWMRVLQRVPESVLWLLEDNADARRNLQREALLRGVAAERLVFAPRLPLSEHLARHAFADLFLDTLPVNAHTTASDALWSGLPVLTCRGQSFSGRVAASLLRAVGLSELVANHLGDYEELAVELPRNRHRLLSLRSRLMQGAPSSMLFDTDAYRRRIEAAYVTMWQRHLRGDPPLDIRVST